MEHAAVLVPSVMFLAIDSTIFRLVLEAGLFAKLILLILLTLSIISWGVAYDKWSLFRRVERQAIGIRADVARMKSAAELEDLSGSGYSGPLLGMVRESQKALQRLRQAGHARNEAVREFQRGSERAAIDAMGLLEKNLVVLSTTTTASPFLGLLGTCWGIMISFINIGCASSASLDIVAPGIAEALIATIAGLATAIPALVFYNLLTSRLRKIEDELQTFSMTVVELLERETRSERVAR